MDEALCRCETAKGWKEREQLNGADGGSMEPEFNLIIMSIDEDEPFIWYY